MADAYTTATQVIDEAKSLQASGQANHVIEIDAATTILTKLKATRNFVRLVHTIP